ncbi:MAG: PhzF family phenazine biosynthesis protein [Rhodospirillales bacterium]|jgi:PhzF family phenazine biosynthesis protein|nr:PhzF family phenazine biosynthesis protein [Rhodospirillales bacterium]
MTIPLYQIDAFAEEIFQGNPAAVCPLREWLADERMQAIAAENNLSETAFFVPGKKPGDYDLRWFTPAAEIDLCGHATLASAYLIMSRLAPDLDVVRFSTLSGTLEVRREGELLALVFPARPPDAYDPAPGLVEALGVEPEGMGASRRDVMAVYGDEATVRAMAPDLRLLAAIDRQGVIVTAPGDECDFVSRFFAPALGVDEDPVTGSAHCTLIPYWAERLGKTELHARQISARGGELTCRAMGERVGIAGQARLYMEGTIAL